eukprot:PhM_4_TR1169/c0_g1_i1/m.65194
MGACVCKQAEPRYHPADNVPAFRAAQQKEKERLKGHHHEQQKDEQKQQSNNAVVEELNGGDVKKGDDKKDEQTTKCKKGDKYAVAVEEAPPAVVDKDGAGTSSASPKLPKFWRCVVCMKSNDREKKSTCVQCGADKPEHIVELEKGKRKGAQTHSCTCGASKIVGGVACPFPVSKQAAMRPQWVGSVVCTKRPQCCFVLPAADQCTCFRLAAADSLLESIEEVKAKSFFKQV